MHVRRLAVITTFGWLIWCNQVYAEPSHAEKNKVLIKCPKRLLSKPPGQRYECSVDVSGVVDHDRWLVFPFLMGDRFKPSQVINLLQVNHNTEGVVSFWALESDDSFAAIPIPARSRLHIKKWIIESMEPAGDITIWLGDDLPLSSRETLSTVFKRLTAKSSAVNDSSERSNWAAPEGTTIFFDPKGMQTIHLELPPSINSALKK